MTRIPADFAQWCSLLLLGESVWVVLWDRFVERLDLWDVLTLPGFAEAFGFLVLGLLVGGRRNELD